MTKRQDELERFLRDAYAFVVINSTNTKVSTEQTLAHDLIGLIRRDKCFLPRVTGYARKLAERGAL